VAVVIRAFLPGGKLKEPVLLGLPRAKEGPRTPSAARHVSQQRGCLGRLWQVVTGAWRGRTGGSAAT